jgi:serine/threonine protein kinase
MSDASLPSIGSLSPADARQVEALCNRFEAAWKAGPRPQIEVYLREVVEPALSVLFVELVQLDLAYRRLAGETPVAADYLPRFPGHARLIEALFQVSAEPVSLPEQPITDEVRATGEFVSGPWVDPAALSPALPYGPGRLPLAPTGFASGPASVGEAPAVPGYEVLGELGRGGMGVVYKARQVKLNRVVALKMILAGAHAGEAELTRFHAEARAIARLQHPHIVQIYDIGEHQGLPYFCLEFMGGGSLRSMLQGGRQPAEAAAELVESLARAMHYAHGQGVVHRDLKPANVLLAADGIVKITDFGLAKRLDEPGLTASDVVMGTPSYMAPEQASGRSKEVGPPADVYALGAILYECLTGRPPFRAATVMDTIRQVLTEEPVPPRLLCNDLSPDLDTICLKCLAKEPAERYASAEELAEDLRRFRGGEPLSASPIGEKEWVTRWSRRMGYEIIEELARGGMGVVYKARQVSLNRLVALKMSYVLPPAPQTLSPELVRRPCVSVHVAMDRQIKRLILKDVRFYNLGPQGEETQIEYIIHENWFRSTILRLTTPVALLHQPDELACHLVDKLSLPTEIAEAIAHSIVEGRRFHQEETNKRLAEHREAAARRIRIEAETVGQLQHPNLVQIFDFGEVSGLRYFSMELMEGGTLSQKTGSSPQPPRDAARVVETLARAVHYAHQRGVVHRDLKPANVLLTCDGLHKVADFGLVKNLQSVEKLDEDGSIMGTPNYMSPEQASGKIEETGPRSDIYSLGAILYELLTGRPPFEAATVLDTLWQVIEDKPVPPGRLQPRVPHDLETICLKCLEKEPQKRYDSAEALAEDLQRFLAKSFWRRVWQWAMRRLLAGLKWRGSVRPRTAVLCVLAALAALWYFLSRIR